MHDYLYKLSKELRQISKEIADMKIAAAEMKNSPEKKVLKQKIKDKRYQALFYISKIENLSKSVRKDDK